MVMKQLLLAISLFFGLAMPVDAQVPNYTASPSAVPTVTKGPGLNLPINIFPKKTVTPTPTMNAACMGLQIVSGNNGLTPTTVKFQALTNNQTGIQKYRFHFGDGVVSDAVSQPMIMHTYTTAGTFEASVELQDKLGVWTNNGTCMTPVTIQSPPLLNNAQTGCSELVITGDKVAPPVTVKLTVKGFGKVEGYRLVYSDGQTIDQTSNVFTKQYTTSGTFEVKSYAKDASGNYLGGDVLCRKSVFIYTQPMTSQPQTGVGLGVWLAIMAALSSGLWLWRLADQKVRRHERRREHLD
jgi:hypothetical protein